MADPLAPPRAVIIAGGNGTRMHPITVAIPKVLLPLPDGTVLDHLLGSLRRAGVDDVHLLLGHHAELVRAYVGVRHEGAGIVVHDGTAGLGTAGPLQVLPENDSPWLVINGDVIADIDLRALLTEHEETSADLTVVGVRYRTSVPYGVLRHDSAGNLLGLDEKPCIDQLVNGGIYVLGPRARKMIPGSASDMTEVIALCAAAELRVRIHSLDHGWFDVGTPATYEALMRSELVTSAARWNR
jgi:NDP-sugar pyrophosphorylase family protein